MKVKLIKKEDDLFEQKLKKHSVAEIEQVISNAISKLIGSEYIAEINEIDFKSDSLSYMNDGHDIKLTI